MVATGSLVPSTRAISEPAASPPACSSSTDTVTGRLQARPLPRRISSTTLSYSSRSMNPSRGLKTPVEIICRSDRARGLKGTFGRSAASIERSLRSSSGTTQSMSSPPCGAMALSVLRTSVGKSRLPRYGWDRMRRQLVVVGQTVLVGGLELLGQLGVPALGRLYASAALGILVPPLPVLPSPNIPRLPREGAGPERYLEVLAVGGEHARRVLREGHRVDDGNVLPRVRRITEEPVQLLVASLLQRKVGPHLVQRHQHILRVSHDKRIDESRGELGAQHLLCVVGHVLEEKALLA